MPEIGTHTGIAGAGLTLHALAVLRLTQSGHLPRPFVYVGSAALPFAAWLEGLTLGWDLGIPSWLGMLAICGLAVTFVPTFALGNRVPVIAKRQARGATMAEAVRGVPVGITVTAVVGASVYSLAAATAFATLMPIAAADRALLAVVLAPLLWTGWSLYLATAPDTRGGHVAGWAALAIALGSTAANLG